MCRDHLQRFCIFDFGVRISSFVSSRCRRLRRYTGPLEIAHTVCPYAEAFAPLNSIAMLFIVMIPERIGPFGTGESSMDRMNLRIQRGQEIGNAIASGWFFHQLNFCRSTSIDNLSRLKSNGKWVEIKFVLFCITLFQSRISSK